MKKHSRPLWITRTKAGTLAAITTRKPTAEALAKLGEPVTVEITTRAPQQRTMPFEADCFALAAQHYAQPTQRRKNDTHTPALF
jgi:hypothetical protein